MLMLQSPVPVLIGALKSSLRVQVLIAERVIRRLDEFADAARTSGNLLEDSQSV